MIAAIYLHLGVSGYTWGVTPIDGLYDFPVGLPELHRPNPKTSEGDTEGDVPAMEDRIVIGAERKHAEW